jgi:HEPN domain-containing protein
MKAVTAQWVKKAEADHRAANGLRRKNPPVHDVVCFHAQQCAAKYLKGLMEEIGLTVPKTHDLELLLPPLLPHHPLLRSLRRGLKFLSNFAVGTRYPGEDANKRQAEAALRWRDRVRSMARALLGIRERRPQRRKPT